MRHAVLAAAMAFNPRLAWTPRPVVRLTRRAAGLMLSYLDRKRRLVDGASALPDGLALPQ